uniref:cell division protein FtsX n=1 Tax=Flavobacterium sp. TaxID=239 RepID=UPI00404B23DB
MSSYFSVVLSVFLVLFLLGTLGFFVINSKKITNDFKEQIPMSIYFNDLATDSVLKAYETKIKAADFVKNYTFVTKEEAAANHMKDIGENFIEFIGENPLKNSFDIYLKADYVEKDSIAKIEKFLKDDPTVADFDYDKIMVDLVNDNIKKISFWILIVSGFFAFISVLLINSSMRLAIYSNRFIIKTMQMVGATKSFIRKPFIWRSIRLGIIGAVLAMIAIYGLLLYVDKNLPSLHVLNDPMVTYSVLGGVLLFGILISWFSTFFATQKFLNLRTDELY